MIEKWICKHPDMILKPKLPTMDIWLIFSYLPTFLPGGKMGDKRDLGWRHPDVT